MNVIIRVKSNTASKLFRAMSNDLKAQKGMAKAVTRGMLNETKQFYREKQSAFWGGIGRSWQDTSPWGCSRISVLGDQGAILLHKIHGGRIKPKNTKNLAIPATEEAKKAGSPRLNRHPPLKLGAWGKDRKPHALVEADNVKKIRGKWSVVKAKEKVWYWLVKWVDQHPDPYALPSSSRLQTVIEKSAVNYINQLIKRSQRAPKT